MVAIIVVLVVALLILGAISGGQSFGDTLSKGCGCLVLIVIALIAFAYFTSK